MEARCVSWKTMIVRAGLGCWLLSGCSITHTVNANGTSNTRIAFLTPVVIDAADSKGTQISETIGAGVFVQDREFSVGLYRASATSFPPGCKAVFFPRSTREAADIKALLGDAKDLCVTPESGEAR